MRVPTVLQPFMGGLDFIPYNAKKVAEFLEEKNPKPEEKGAKKGGKKEGKKEVEEKKVEEK